MTTIEKGKFGEQKAEAYLVTIGYKILTRNYRQKYGEIDIIAEELGTAGSTIVFFEVKTWENFTILDLEYSINYKKQYKIKKTSYNYLYTNVAKSYKYIRYDVILIQNDTIHHIKGAF
ncbi:MAG: YraN family protein [Spirochaetia bacterium]|nr:YraN family protein [Spirochaetia bacterium]